MGPQQEGASPITNFIFIGGIILVFYFFMIRPQQKKAKQQKNFKNEIKKGDRVVTIGGLHGKVVEVKDATMSLETEGGHRLKVEKAAISMDFTKNTGEANTQDLTKSA